MIINGKYRNVRFQLYVEAGKFAGFKASLGGRNPQGI